MIASIPNLNGGGLHSPKKVIIHSMGQFIEAGDVDYYAPQWLEKLGYSAHFLIDPSGVIIKTRNTDLIAYHAKGFNTDTLGIEILVKGVHTYDTFLKAIREPYMSREQYDSLLYICKPLNHLEFARHSDISPGRKSDPGDGFDWKQFKKDIS